MSVEILPVEASHPYLGRLLCMDASSRSNIEFNNRLRMAWAKFNSFRRWLVNRHTPIQLRLRLLEATVQPTVLFGMVALPVGARNLQRLAATQRKMLRAMVGWARLDSEDWRETMVRMNARLDRASQARPIHAWDDVVARQKCKFAAHLCSSKCEWPRRLAQWTPESTRPRRRPNLRWDDPLNALCRLHAGAQHWWSLSSVQRVELSKGFCV